MRNETIASTGGEVTEKPKVKARAPSRARRIAAWKKQNEDAYALAHMACCTCTPSRAQSLLVDQFNGRANIPID